MKDKCRRKFTNCFCHLSTRWQKSIKDVAEAKGIPRIIITKTDDSTDIRHPNSQLKCCFAATVTAFVRREISKSNQLLARLFFFLVAMLFK